MIFKNIFAGILIMAFILLSLPGCLSETNLTDPSDPLQDSETVETAASRSAADSPRREMLVLYDTHLISGELREGSYLSVSDNSEMEYLNLSYSVYLEHPVDILEPSGRSILYEGIDHIEIQNPFEYDLENYSAIRIKGIVKPFSEQSGYSRQYSTPVQVEILEILQGK